jgi:chromosomal replication initiation ATPase DnaA
MNKPTPAYDVRFASSIKVSMWRLGFDPPPLPLPKMSDIAKAVSEEYRVSLDDLRGPCRQQYISRPRQAAMWRMWRVKREDGVRKFTLTQIAGYFRRDHTTILHGIKAHQKRLEDA